MRRYNRQLPYGLSGDVRLDFSHRLWSSAKHITRCEWPAACWVSRLFGLVSRRWSVCQLSSLSTGSQTAVRLTTVVMVAPREHCPISCSVSVERPYNTPARSAFHRRLTRLMSKCSSSGHRSVCLPWTIFNLSAVRHLGFHRKWILSVSQTPRIHSGLVYTKCQQNRLMHSWVIAIWQIFPRRYQYRMGYVETPGQSLVGWAILQLFWPIIVLYFI